MAEGTRTPDHRDHNPGLYQLSYRHRARDRIPLHSRGSAAFDGWDARPYPPKVVEREEDVMKVHSTNSLRLDAVLS